MVLVMALKQFVVAFPQEDADRAVVHQMFHGFLLGDAEGTVDGPLLPFLRIWSQVSALL